MKENYRKPDPFSIIGLYAAEHAQDPLPGELHPPTLDNIPVTRVTAALDAAQEIPVFEGKPQGAQQIQRVRKAAA